MIKYFHSVFSPCYLLPMVVFSFSSCEKQVQGLDPERLDSQILDLEEKLENLKSEAEVNPGDQSLKIKQADQDLDQLWIEKIKLEEQYRLEQEIYSNREKEFNSYQQDYPVNGSNP